MTSIPLEQSMADPIRRWRQTAGLTQAELAGGLGTTQSAVSRWENGHDEPRLATLAAILRVCGLRGEVVVDIDVDRAQIRQQLAMSPRQRLASSANVSRMLAAATVWG
ncbi:MAG TPA: helix-turn-helix transcriptional regulator [Acidimicrobiia bacterium]|nr:helix-turn-helix transcriptional regulator [Acidimicrobiia bacterium]